MVLVFVLARKRRLDLVAIRAVAERRPPERSAVKEKTRSLLDHESFGERKNLLKNIAQQQTSGKGKSPANLFIMGSR
jgi:hypothetical protein